MFRMVRKRKAHFPGLKLMNKETTEEIGGIASRGIPRNIIEQKRADETGIKSNSPLWQRTKRRLGWDARSLIAKKRSFTQSKGASASFPYELKKKSIIIRPSQSARTGGYKGGPTAAFKDVAIWVQQKGYTGWFGLREKTKKLIRTVIRKFIKKEFAKARAKR